MENFVFDGEENQKAQTFDDEETAEGGFMAGFVDEGEVEECAECGAAVADEKKVVKEIGDEEYLFCSELCAKEFEESLGSK